MKNTFLTATFLTEHVTKQVFKHFTIIGYRFSKKKKNVFLYLKSSYLHLTHPSAHTLGAVGTVHSGEARPPHVTLYKIHLFETR